VRRHFRETLVADLLDVLLHEAVVVAPSHTGGADSRFLGASGNLMGVQVMQVELVDEGLLDLLVQSEEAIGIVSAECLLAMRPLAELWAPLEQRFPLMVGRLGFERIGTRREGSLWPATQ
jgi:hypothetical protein